MDPIPKNYEQENNLDPRVESLAIPLARDYAEKNYPKREDGTFEPAWRGVNGEKELRGKSPADVAETLVADGWTQEAAEAQAEAMVIDIANTPYDQFSEHWKEQNRGGAEFLAGMVDKYGEDRIRSLNLQDPNVVIGFGTLIHDNWLTRNEWVLHPDYGNPDLAKPFAELSDEEKKKDIDQLSVLQKWLEQQLLGEYGYDEGEEERYAYAKVREEQLVESLAASDPQQFDIKYPGNIGDRGVLIALADEVSKQLSKEIGQLNRQRFVGYKAIKGGKPRSAIKKILSNG
ncbi:MAG: hypothetical protein Q4F02_02520 [Candidatus Saccharibacteria bacterium]|nr:hypothetical protein [Candidatus Saccharibacteria bacterium]